MGLFFYPRGGSARGAGCLARALPAVGGCVTLAWGSLGDAGALGYASPRWRASLRRSAATLTISQRAQCSAVKSLGVATETVYAIPNGVDIARFNPQRPSSEDRRAHWLRWLVSDPRGWNEATARPGSI